MTVHDLICVYNLRESVLNGVSYDADAATAELDIGLCPWQQDGCIDSAGWTKPVRLVFSDVSALTGRLGPCAGTTILEADACGDELRLLLLDEDTDAYRELYVTAGAADVESAAA